MDREAWHAAVLGCKESDTTERLNCDASSRFRGGGGVEGPLRAVPGHQRHQHVLRLSRSPQGLSPAAHLGDGSSDLILIRKCSRFNFLRFLVRHTNQGDQVRVPRPPRRLRQRVLHPGGPSGDRCACEGPQQTPLPAIHPL